MKKGIDLLRERERKLLERARRVVYRSFDDGLELALHFYLPPDLREGEPRSCLLFLHGGAWMRGNVVQLAPHALHFVERGMVCGLVEYRQRGMCAGASPVHAREDARSALRYVRLQAGELHVDPERVALVGACAGANAAAALALGAPPEVKGKGEPDSDPGLTAKPAAAILLSSIFDVTKGSYGYDACRAPAEAKAVCLSRLVDSGASPMLLLHGNSDRLVPFEEAESFAGRLERKKVPVKLVEFEGRDRDFFHLNYDPVSFEAVLLEMESFLVERSFLTSGSRGDDPRVISRREEDF
ncbi:MAG: alpha/beta hydrolase [Verrucomicrobiae bacterium]|nr:alpha/beta hydrolase [Verrucomicrobiae bacterium]